MLVTQEECRQWNEFLQYAEDKCSATAFENWLRPINVLEYTEDDITLEVPNIFVQEYLLDNYKKDLCAFLPLKGENEPAINFVIQKPSKKESKASPEPTKISEDYHPHFELKLNQQYKFDNFIEGPSNQFVKSAAMGIATHPARSYNPLFIHGRVGLGKTHLLHAIGHEIKNRHKHMRIQCITTEAFINDLVDSLRNKSIAQMKRFYRSLDVLIVDDIQFLQNRLNFEEEFCHTFETLINQNKQIVVACDKPPGQLKLSERMVARMEWGLVAQLGIPDLETRVAILQYKSEQKGVKLPQDIAFYLAERLCNNVRQLEGAINRLCAFSRLLGTDITVSLIEEYLGEMLHQVPTQKVSVEQILKAVTTVYQIKVTDLKGSVRTKEIALARQVAMYLAKELVTDSLTMIGASFGKTHSTILHAHKTIEQKLKQDELLKRQVDMVRKSITA